MLCLIVCLLGAAFTPQPVVAEETDSDRDRVLAELGYRVWLRVNIARQNPRAVIDRLGLSEDTVRRVLGEEDWLIDEGLDPLAWNDQLATAAVGHGQDMLDRIYYSHRSPDGDGPYERIAATGYEARLEDETLGLLVFSNYLAVETALDAMIDMMLRDELTGVAGVSRNIFSTELSEVGIALFAENVVLLADQPYVYLLVLDFASPVEPRYFIVGVADAGDKVALQSSYTGFWELLAVLPGGGFQVACPVGGSLLVSVDESGSIKESLRLHVYNPISNHWADLRRAALD